MYAREQLYFQVNNRLLRSILVGVFIFSFIMGSYWYPVHAAGTPNLIIAKVHTGDFTEGDVGIYTITVSNVGDGSTDGTTVTVTDTLPLGLTATDMSGTGWSCVLGTLTCTRADPLDPGLDYPNITLTVNVAVDAAASLTNDVSVSGGGEGSGTMDDNTASDLTTVIQLPDIIITNVTLSPESPDPNQAFDVTISITNRGGENTADDFPIDIYVDQNPMDIIDPLTGCPSEIGYFTQPGDRYINSLPAGSSTVKIANFTSGLPEGVHYLWIYADADCIVGESFESNNNNGPVIINSGFNDIDTAKVISIPYSHSTDTTSATTAVDDPNVPECGAGQGFASVWYSYTPSADGIAYFDTFGSNYNTIMAVWTGTRGNLTSVICNDTTLTLGVTAGVTYYIEVIQNEPSVPPQIGGALAFHATSFADVPSTYWAWRWIEGLYRAGITGGCATSPSKLYCPDNPVTRAQMAVFLLKGMHGSSFAPPPVGASTGFGDVPTDYWAAAWIKQLAVEGITSGCGSGVYCPENPVTRAQMAVFLLKSGHGTAYTPPPVGTGTGFSDVPADYWAAAWIKQLAAEGITSGCGSGIYCPDNPVTRAQMAVFLDKTFNLPPLP